MVAWLSFGGTVLSTKVAVAIASAAVVAAGLLLANVLHPHMPNAGDSRW